MVFSRGPGTHGKISNAVKLTLGLIVVLTALGAGLVYLNRRSVNEWAAFYTQLSAKPLYYDVAEETATRMHVVRKFPLSFEDVGHLKNSLIPKQVMSFGSMPASTLGTIEQLERHLMAESDYLHDFDNWLPATLLIPVETSSGVPYFDFKDNDGYPKAVRGIVETLICRAEHQRVSKRDARGGFDSIVRGMRITIEVLRDSGKSGRLKISLLASTLLEDALLALAYQMAVQKNAPGDLDALWKAHLGGPKLDFFRAVIEREFRELTKKVAAFRQTNKTAYSVYALQNGDPLTALELARKRVDDALAKPFPQGYPEIEAFAKRVASGRGVNRLLAYACPDLALAYRQYVRALARYRALSAVIACVWKQAATGKYPASLDELESFMATKGRGVIENDPFSDKPYRFKFEGGGVKIWSVGDDRKDDDGVEPRDLLILQLVERK